MVVIVGQVDPLGRLNVIVTFSLVVWPAAKNLPLVILKINPCSVGSDGPLDLALTDPLDVEPSLQLIVPVPLASTVPAAGGVARLEHVPGVRVWIDEVMLPPVMVPLPEHPVNEFEPLIVCVCDTLLIPGDRVAVPEPLVHVSKVEAKAGVAPIPTTATPLTAAKATARLRRFNLTI
jgi:hypothetical protein